MSKINLTTIENMTVKFCENVQTYCHQLDLSYITIQEGSKILVELHRVQRDLNTLQCLNKTHEVYANGKSLGELFDNEEIGNKMLSTRIVTGAYIDATENEIRYLTRKLII